MNQRRRAGKQSGGAQPGKKAAPAEESFRVRIEWLQIDGLTFLFRLRFPVLWIYDRGRAMV